MKHITIDVDDFKAAVRATWSESDFLAAVIDLAHEHGWRVAHFRASRTSKGWRTAVQADGKGWPDLFMVRADGRRLACELKVKHGRITPEQAQWLVDLQTAGIDSYLWTPRAWNEIVATLRRIKA